MTSDFAPVPLPCSLSGREAKFADPFAAELVSETNDVLDVLWGCRLRQVNSLGGRIVGVPLKRRLHAHVHLRCQFMAGDVI